MRNGIICDIAMSEEEIGDGEVFGCISLRARALAE